MSQWPNAPSMVLSSRANRLFSVETLAGVARQSGVNGLDLDLAGRAVTLAGFSSGPSINPKLAGGIDSVWLPLRRAPRMAGGRIDFLLNDWITLARDVGARRLVVDREAALHPIGSQDKRPLLIRLQAALDSSTRVTVVLRPGELEGTRAHLTMLGALRRTAEEWDFDLAVDLAGEINARWEAEAALQRLHSRLKLVRVASLDGGGAPGSRSRLTGRSLAYLLDQSFSGTLSLVPRLPWNGWLSQSMLERRTYEEAQAIADRHRRIFSPTLPTPRQASPQER